jgi:hypothetical protein
MTFGLGKAAVVAALLASGLALPAAHAAPPPPHTVAGGCYFNADSQGSVTNPDTFVGVLGIRATIFLNNTPDSSDSWGSCSLQVNGGEVDAILPTPGPVVVNQKETVFVAHPGDVTSLCTTIHWSDGTTTTTCGNSIDLQIPPQPVIDLLDSIFVVIDGVLVTIDSLLNPVFDAVNNFEKDHIDPVVCPQLAAHAGNYGGVIITDEGDVLIPDPAGLGLTKIWDCPVYDA